jgi:DNA-directed RNA polymerase specialized sigma24 family protein
MPTKRNITHESFDAVLSWLDEDRDAAGAKYEQLRSSLIRILGWHGCFDAEGLADEVLDRVAEKVDQLRPTYVGDPRAYFYAVANNVAREQRKQNKLRVSIDDSKVASAAVVHHNELTDPPSLPVKCFSKCLAAMSDDKRRLLLDYYREQKRDKINHRKVLATRLGLDITALRVRIHRLRLSLEQCIERCLREESE